MYTGSCLCERITWEVDSTPCPVYHCHCSMCRKIHGAAFGTYAYAPTSGFRWTGKTDSLRNYRSSPSLVRSFCSCCGSVVPNPDEEEDYVYIPIGCQDDGPKADCHIFAASKAPWLELTDGLPKHDRHPPGVDLDVFSPEVPDSPEAGVVRGSCLCSAIRFRVTAPFRVIYNCHCRRCRRARSAAFTTNGFTADSDVIVTHGEEHLKSYKIPEAKYFTQVFCELCGSGMPRISSERGVAVTPLGALDDDPGRKPDCNIWFASRANWYEPVNDLLSHDEDPPR